MSSGATIELIDAAASPVPGGAAPRPPVGRRRCAGGGALRARPARDACARPRRPAPARRRAPGGSWSMPTTGWPGKQLGRCARMMSSSRTNETPAESGDSHEPRQPRRHLHDRRGGVRSLQARRSSSTARLRLSDDSSGNGRETSMASGVRTGRMSSLKERGERRPMGVVDIGPGRATGCRAGASAGNSSWVVSRHNAVTSACALARWRPAVRPV